MSNKTKGLPADTISSFLDGLEAKESSSKRTEKSAGPSRRDLEVALTVLLVDLAGSDQSFEQKEYYIIQNGLKRMFGTAKDEVKGLVNQAMLVLANLRGTSQFAKLLSENLEVQQKVALLEVIDGLIDSDGKEDGFEVYLRNKYAKLLGIRIIEAPNRH